MDCGIPFCNNGCPLGNLIPDWNDLVYRDHWRDAIERLHATNNFPEFTGRLCPAPCEAVVRARDQLRPGHHQAGRGRDRRPRVGRGLDHAADPRREDGQARRRRRLRARRAWRPRNSSPAPATTSSCSSAPIASAACCATASPSSRWRSVTSSAAIEQMRAEGTEFRTSTNVGVDVQRRRAARRVRRDRARRRRDRLARPPDPRPGAAAGSTRRWSTCRSATACRRATSTSRPSRAAGKRVVIIGGGDTGADCLGTAHRQGAASIHQFEILPRPPDSRAPTNPWPTWSNIFRVSSAHEEGGERVYSVNTERFVADDDGNVARAARPRGRDGRRQAREDRGHRLRPPVRARAARDGLSRPAAGGHARRPRRRARRRGATSCATRTS